MGRTERWRYIRYADGGEELYDHASDPHEWTNLAERPEHAGRLAEFGRLLPRIDAPARGGKAGKKAGQRSEAGAAHGGDQAS